MNIEYMKKLMDLKEMAISAYQAAEDAYEKYTDREDRERPMLAICKAIDEQIKEEARR